MSFGGFTTAVTTNSVQYDGTNFSGFQSQKDHSGIQDKIEYSISKLNNDKKN